MEAVTQEQKTKTLGSSAQAFAPQPTISAKKRRAINRKKIIELTNKFVKNGGQVEILPDSKEKLPWKPAFLEVHQ